MKKSITFREITVAIGILVAMVIALTLWVREPAEEGSGLQSSRQQLTPASAAKNLFESSIRMITDIRNFQ